MRFRILTALSLLVVLPTHSAELTKANECVAGLQVTHRNGKSGVVTDIKNGSCVVRHEDGSESSYLHWMLTPSSVAPAAPSAAAAAAGGGLTPGNYSCSATGAGSFPIIIQSDGRYADRTGKAGEFSVLDSREIVFKSGSLAGQYSKLLGPKKFGLSSAKGKWFYTVCHLKAS